MNFRIFIDDKRNYDFWKGDIPIQAQNVVLLIASKWDDYTYKTSFIAKYCDNVGKQYDLGVVKIARGKMISGERIVDSLDKEFDYLFIDIWHNPEDGLPMYLKLKRLLKNKQLTISYWLEKSILAMYRRCLLTIIEETMVGCTKKDYLKAKTEYDQIINDLYFKTENMSFSSIGEIKDLLQDKELEKLI